MTHCPVLMERAGLQRQQSSTAGGDSEELCLWRIGGSQHSWHDQAVTDWRLRRSTSCKRCTRSILHLLSVLIVFKRLREGSFCWFRDCLTVTSIKPVLVLEAHPERCAMDKCQVQQVLSQQQVPAESSTSGHRNSWKTHGGIRVRMRQVRGAPEQLQGCARLRMSRILIELGKVPQILSDCRSIPQTLQLSPHPKVQSSFQG